MVFIHLMKIKITFKLDTLMTKIEQDVKQKV